MSNSSRIPTTSEDSLLTRSHSQIPSDTSDPRRTDVDECKHLSTDLLNFVIEVWGVDAAKASKIQGMEITLPQADIESYKRNAGDSENDIHELFIDFCDTLLKAALRELGEPDVVTVSGSWNGNRNATLASDRLRRKKSDHVHLWIPLPAEDLVPQWKEAGAGNMMSKKEAISTSHTALDLESSATLTPTSAAGSSGVTSTTLGKRSISVVTDSSAADERDFKKSRSSFSKKLQLGKCALESVATTSRYFTTGILVDVCEVVACYFDRNVVLCAHPFFFDKEPQNLALILYALNQCDPVKAGFDSHIRKSSAQASPQNVTESLETQLLASVSGLVGSRFEFPRIDKAGRGEFKADFSTAVVPGAEPVPESGRVQSTLATSAEDIAEVVDAEDTVVRLLVTGIIRQPDVLVSRGTTVYKVKYEHDGGMLSEEDYALKLSWPSKSRTSEIEVVERLRNVLPVEVQAHLPNFSYSTTYTCEQLGLPWTRLQLPLDDSKYQERVLRVMVADRYIKLWEAESVDEFLEVWLDCVESHREAYRIGKVLHGDLSDNNLMMSRLKDGTAIGILNDWDMASMSACGSEDRTVTGSHHRTGTPPFMAMDLLMARPWGHLYRYELESFVYILVWAAVHYNFKAKTRAERVHKSLVKWVTGSSKDRGDAKQFLVRIKNSYAREEVYMAIGEEFEPILDTVIEPLLDFIADGYADKPCRHDENYAEYDFETCGGHITFHKFMKTIGRTPRWDKADLEDRGA